MKTNINIDYLIINLDLDNPKFDLEFMDSDFFSARVMEYGTKNFQRIAEIYHKKKQIGILTFNPYSGSVLSPSFAQFQAVNSFLYEPLNWQKLTLQDCFLWLGCKVLGLNRIDLAIDGLINQTFDLRLKNLFFAVSQGDFLICGKEKNFNCFSSSKNALSGWTIGSKSSDRFLRFYLKSAEIKNNPKPWIINYWDNLIGFDKEEKERVYRMEYQLNRRFLRSLDKENWVLIFDRKFMLSMFINANRTFLDIRENKNYSRETDNPSIKFLDLSGLANNLEKDILFERHKREPSIYEGKKIRELKMTLKKLFWIYWRGQQTNSLSLVFMHQIFNLNRVYFEDMFFDQKKAYWIAEFQEKEKLKYNFDYLQLQNDFKNTAFIEI